MLCTSRSFSTPVTVHQAQPPDTASAETRPRENSTYLPNQYRKIQLDINLPGLAFQVSALTEVSFSKFSI
jgi:hypothetical protein